MEEIETFKSQNPDIVAVMELFSKTREIYQETLNVLSPHIEVYQSNNTDPKGV